MTFAEFQKSLSTAAPPDKISPLLLALWSDARGDWDTAHRIAQDIATPDGSRVHAYLHRKEGNQWNAEYWYRSAGIPPFNGELTEEWRSLVEASLQSA
jgi:hypothetical protein